MQPQTAIRCCVVAIADSPMTKEDTMKMPGFTADAALTSGGHLRTGAPTSAWAADAVTPQMRCVWFSNTTQYCCSRNRHTGEERCGLVNVG